MMVSYLREERVAEILQNLTKTKWNENITGAEK